MRQFRKQAVHETAVFQKNAEQGDPRYSDFVVGDRVMTVDGIPGKVADVQYGPFNSQEQYDVVLDNKMGGGTYTAGQLTPLGQQGVVSSLSVEAESQLTAATNHVANIDYPELGDILETRLPNENIKVYASFGVNDYVSDTEDGDDNDPKDDGDSAEESDDADTDDADVDGEEQDNDEESETDGPQVAPPDACSYCGYNQFEDPQMTGRGVRMRCGQCGGTMVSWGGQWQPEFPNSSQNNASETWDTRSGGPGGVVQAPGANYKTTSLQTDAGIKDWLYNRLPDEYKGGSELGTAYSRDWCRFRKNQHCWLPENLNGPATSQVGYAVFSPKDRGFCNRQTWPMQETCPVGEPGPNVGGRKYFSSLNDSELGWHFTASWMDVQSKARRIRREGGVKILVAQNGFLVGEVQGDTAVYESRIQFVPGTKKQADWHCGCKWGAYTWGRSKPFRRFEGRNCSHVLALQYEAQARSMFGKDVREDSIRPAWQAPHQKIVEQYDRSTGENLTRNSSLVYDSDGIYQHPTQVDLVHPPIYAFAQSMLSQGEDPANVISLLKSYGMIHESAVEMLHEAMNDPATGEVVVNGEQHQLEDVNPSAGTATLSNGSTVPLEQVKSPDWHPTLGLDPSDGSTGHTGALAAKSEDDLQDQIDNASSTDEQTALKHEKSMHEDDPRHRKHHTNDAREHAPERNWGLPYGYISPGICTQCGGAGCGHCAGTGQEPPTPDTNGDGSPDQTPDAGGAISSDGVSAALYHYLADLQDYPSNGEATNYDVRTDHSNTQNPGSTGFATSLDPGNWGNGILNNEFGNSYEASKVALKEGQESIPPTVSGVALKAADTGRVLMLQRGIHDSKDKAAGTWEFPGGHHEEGDLTSLHAGIREWEEEVGQPFPEGGHVAHAWRSGPYQGHVVVIPSEDAVKFHEGRSTVNPDNPDGDKHEQSAWWHPEDAAKNPALREELKKSGPFKDIQKAAALPVHRLPVDQFIERFTPGEYDPHSTGDWEQVEHHPDFMKKNSFNPERVHRGNWNQFVDHVRQHGIQSPVTVDPETETVEAGHHRVVAAMHTGADVPYVHGTYEGDEDTYKTASVPSVETPGARECACCGSTGEHDNGKECEVCDGSGYQEGIEPNALCRMGILNDSPEPALPRTDASEEDPDDIGSIVAKFQQTAGAKAILDSAPELKANLAKTSMKEFSFQEQQELINEGSAEKTLARNFGSLQIEGTHYELLGDDDDDNILWI